MIDRYMTEAMSAIWDEDRKYGYWLKTELAVCEANAENGVFSREELKTILGKAAFDVEAIHRIENEVHHDVIAFLTSVADFVGPESRWVHYGMTSSDLLDTAFALQLRDSADVILKAVDRLIDLLSGKALEYRDLLTIGRTHGIHAEPTTYGLKFLNWHQEMLRHRQRFADAREGIRYGAISGAVGTYAHISPGIEAAVCEKLDLKADPVTTQVIQRDRHAHYMSVLAGMAASLEKISVEIRHLQRTEVHEVEEPFSDKQKGSSAMPHKKNPIIAERITGMARLFRGFTVTALENVALWHERDISHSSAERVIFPDALHLMDYMLKKMIWLLDGLRLFPENIQKNLQLTGGLHHSQKVLLALVNAGLSREEAYRKIQALAMKTWETGVALDVNLREDPETMKILEAGGTDVSTLFRDEDFLKNVAQIYERCGVK